MRILKFKLHALTFAWQIHLETLHMAPQGKPGYRACPKERSSELLDEHEVGTSTVLMSVQQRTLIG